VALFQKFWCQGMKLLGGHHFDQFRRLSIDSAAFCCVHWVCLNASKALRIRSAESGRTPQKFQTALLKLRQVCCDPQATTILSSTDLSEAHDKGGSADKRFRPMPTQIRNTLT
jgi:hypothetical protein